MPEIAGVRSQGERAGTTAAADKCPIRDMLVDGPNGMKILAGRRFAVGKRQAASSQKRSMERTDIRSEQKELLEALPAMRDAFDVILVDTGAGLSRVARRLWLRSQLVILIATCDDAAVMDAYAAAKRHSIGARDATLENVRLLVNRAETDRAAADAHRRLTNCCQRFLRQSVTSLPALPLWDGGEDAIAARHPRVWENPNSEFGHAALWLGRAMADVLESNKPTVHDAGGRRHSTAISKTGPSTTERDAATLDGDWKHRA
jgi:flagellar biosynthesis protein FlhG